LTGGSPSGERGEGARQSGGGRKGRGCWQSSHRLVEVQVRGDHNHAAAWNIDPVVGRGEDVANEAALGRDDQLPPALGRGYGDCAEAAKHLEVGDVWLRAGEQLVGCVAALRGSRRAVPEVVGSDNGLGPKVVGQVRVDQHAAGLLHQRAVEPLSSAILLRGVGGGRLVLDTSRGEVGKKLSGKVLTAPITAQGLHCTVQSPLPQRNDAPNRLIHVRLVLERQRAGVAAAVVQHRDKVVDPTQGGNMHGPADVGVDKIKRCSGPGRVGRVGDRAGLAEGTGLTLEVGVVSGPEVTRGERHASDKVVPGKLLKVAPAEVPKASVPEQSR